MLVTTGLNTRPHKVPTLSTKVEGPYLATLLIRTPIIEWYVVWCGSKNGYRKTMLWKEIGLHAQNVITILKSTINIKCWNLYYQLMSTRLFTAILI
jgi:hypothetical protein